MILEAEDGDIVTVHFTVAFKNGEILESTRGKDPLKFKLGINVFFPGFEKAIVGMAIGQTKRVTISAKDAFGPKDAGLFREVKKSEIPKHIDASVGKHIHIKHEDNNNLVVAVVEDKGDSVVLDANPPQAGEDFVVSLELVDLA
jgi:peptidylprolyl isomerase